MMLFERDCCDTSHLPETDSASPSTAGGLKRQETNRLLIQSNKKHGEPGAVRMAFALVVSPKRHTANLKFLAGAPKGADQSRLEQIAYEEPFARWSASDRRHFNDRPRGTFWST